MMVKPIIVWMCLTFIFFSTHPATAIALTPQELQFENEVIQVLRNHPEVILESVEHYQSKQYEEKEQEKIELLSQVQTNPKRIIAQSPTTGRIEDQIILIEFSDFQCSYCAKAHEVLSQFVAKYADQVTLVYKHYPLETIHAEAMPAAKASWAAAQQDKFWEYHDLLFAHQKRLGELLFVNSAQELGLDIEKFNDDRNSTDAQAAIQWDIRLADKLGLNGTPFFLMNDQIFSGVVEYSKLEALLYEF